jgi:hypothetical protein
MQTYIQNLTVGIELLVTTFTKNDFCFSIFLFHKIKNCGIIPRNNSHIFYCIYDIHRFQHDRFHATIADQVYKAKTSAYNLCSTSWQEASPLYCLLDAGSEENTANLFCIIHLPSEAVDLFLFAKNGWVFLQQNDH